MGEGGRDGKERRGRRGRGGRRERKRVEGGQKGEGGRRKGKRRGEDGNLSSPPGWKHLQGPRHPHSGGLY